MQLTRIQNPGRVAHTPCCFFSLFVLICLVFFSFFFFFFLFCLAAPCYRNRNNLWHCEPDLPEKVGNTERIRIVNLRWASPHPTPPIHKLKRIHCILDRGSYRGGLWHGSRIEKIGNHGSRKSKFRFLESRK